MEAARRGAALASLSGQSMADRFAAATAEQVGARLYTTDFALATALGKRRVAPPVTLFWAMRIEDCSGRQVVLAQFVPIN